MRLPTPGRQVLALPALAVLVLVATPGCEGGSGEARPSLTSSPTVSLPSESRSLPASPTATRSGIDRTSTDASAEPTTDDPATEEPTSTKPTPASSSAATSTTPATAGTESSDDTTSPWPLLVALAAIAAALVGVVVVIRRRSARRDWNTALDAARAESEVLARDLAPSLLAGTRESRRGGWEVARPRVVTLEDQLTALARSAHHVPDSTVASELAAAVSDVRRTLDEEVRAPEHQGTAALWAAHDAAQRLEERLAVLASPTSRGSS